MSTKTNSPDNYQDQDCDGQSCYFREKSANLVWFGLVSFNLVWCLKAENLGQTLYFLVLIYFSYFLMY